MKKRRIHKGKALAKQHRVIGGPYYIIGLSKRGDLTVVVKSVIIVIHREYFDVKGMDADFEAIDWKRLSTVSIRLRLEIY